MYCDEYVCSSVYLIARVSQKPHDHICACMLPATTAQSSDHGVMIRYVLPVLWMTSRFHTVGPTMMRRVYS